MLSSHAFIGNVEKSFISLMGCITSLTNEEAYTWREGLTEEQKATFDILREPNLSEGDKKKIKEFVIELLYEWKSSRSNNGQKTATVFSTVNKTLFEA